MVGLNDQADIIFVIEGTAINGAYLNDLKTNYLTPTLEYFSQGNIEDRDYVCESTSTLYGLVVYHAADVLPKPSSDCYGPYCSPQRLLTTLDKLDLIGGKGESHANIAEGLATALQAFEDLQQKREGTNILTQKHCILVCNSPPYLMPVMESPTYAGFTTDQLAAVFAEQNINLSILSPRKIPAIFKLFEKAGGDLSQCQNKNYAKDPRHLVLLKGFSLKERPVSPTNANNNPVIPNIPSPLPNDGSPMTNPNPMGQPNQLPAPPPGYRPPPQGPQVMAQQPQQQQPQPQQQTQQQLIPGRPAFQPGGPPGYPNIRGQGARWPMAPPQPLTQQQRSFLNAQGPGQTQGPASALIAQLTQPPSQFPNHRLDGPVLGQQMNPMQQQQQQGMRMPGMGMGPGGPMGGVPLGSQMQQGMGPQNINVQQQNMNQLGPGSMIPPGMMNQNMQNQGQGMGGPGNQPMQGPMGNPMQQNQPPQQQNFQNQQNQVLGPGGNQGMQPNSNLGMGAPPNQGMQNQNQNTTGQQTQPQTPQQQAQQQQQQQQQAQQQQQQQQAQQQQQVQQQQQQQQAQQQQQQQQQNQQQQPGGPQAGPGGPGAPMQARERLTIWQGVLEWIEKGKSPNDNQKITKQVPCQISSTPKEGEPDLKADSWPQKLIMQLMPKTLIGSIGGAYLKNSTSVLFHPQQCEALDSLTKVMSSGFAGCVHFTSVPSPTPCDIKVLILLYTVEKRAYLGFIPNDQVAFVDRLRKVIQHQKSNTTALMRQNQMGGVNPGAPQGPGQPPIATSTQQNVMMPQGNTMTMGGNQMGQQQDNQMQGVGGPGLPGPGQNRGGPMLGGPGQGGPQRPPFNQIEAARQQNLAKIHQLQQTLEAAQQQEMQYKSQLEIMNHIKIQQIQQNLEQAQQQEVHYQAQMEQEQKQHLRAQLQQLQQQRQMAPQQLQQGPGQQNQQPQQQQQPNNPQQQQQQQQQQPNQQRMMRPQLTGNPGLRHLLQQQQQPNFRHVMNMGQMQQRPGGAQGGNQQFDDVSNFDFMN